MTVGQAERLPRAGRPPRAIAWVVLLVSALAVLAVGIVATAMVFGHMGGWPARPTPGFWRAFAAACVLTIASLGLRVARWVFLLRRAGTRLPIRDAVVGYLSGLSLLFAPLLAGEIAVRAYVNRARGRVPIQVTIVVNVWERLLDLAALAMLGAAAGALSDRGSVWVLVVLMFAAASLVPAVRRWGLGLLRRMAGGLASWFEPGSPVSVERLAATRSWLAALATSLVAWLLPATGLWLSTRAAGMGSGWIESVWIYSASALQSVFALAPGGIVLAGRQMLEALQGEGFDSQAAALAVVGIRLATTGVSVAIGALFVLVHLRSRADLADGHFDAIADAYDAQIPESRREALLVRKTVLMRDALASLGAGHRGLDVGCGQGAYVGEMRRLGFDVAGIDASAGQVRFAVRNLGVGTDVVTVGSALAIPAPDATYDFAYTINVLHHLDSVEEQQRAFAEIVRVLKPGGILFLHEINTRNILFRFYMGYVFPSLNCIDQGIERWLLPHELHRYTNAELVDVRYFTFLPDFVPQVVVRWLQPIERLLERSRWRIYSAHYMATLRRPS